MLTRMLVPVMAVALFAGVTVQGEPELLGAGRSDRRATALRLAGCRMCLVSGAAAARWRGAPSGGPRCRMLMGLDRR